MCVCDYQNIIKDNIGEIMDLVGVDLSKGGNGVVYMNRYTGKFMAKEDNPSDEYFEVHDWNTCLDCDKQYDCENNWSEDNLVECIVNNLNKK